MAALGSLVASIRLEHAQYTAGLSKVDQETLQKAQSVQRNLDGLARAAEQSDARMAASMERTASVAQGAQTLIANFARTAMGAFAAGQIIKVADEYGQLQSRLEGATRSHAEYVAVQDRLMEVSGRVYRSFGDGVEMYARTAESLRQLGYSSQVAADLVATLSYGLTVNSADAEKTASTINAFSTAILTGKMNTDQFNSVISASPRLQQAMADALGTTNAGLMQMVQNGGLSVDQLMRVVSQMEKLGSEADNMKTSVGDALVSAGSQFGQWINKLNEATGATDAMVGVIDLVVNNLDEIATVGAIAAAPLLIKSFGGMAVAASGSAIAVAKDTLAQIANSQASIARARASAIAAKEDQVRAVAALAVARAEFEAARGTGAHGIALEALMAAQTRANVANAASATAQGAVATAGRAVLGMLGGPAGLITLGATAAAGWLLFRDNANEASTALLDMQAPLDEIVQRFERLNKSQQDIELRALRDAIKAADEEARGALDSLQSWAKTSVLSLNPFEGLVVPEATRTSLAALITQLSEIAAAPGKFSNAGDMVRDLGQAFLATGEVSDSLRRKVEDLVAEFANSLEKGEKNEATLARLERAQREAGEAASSHAGAIRDLNAGMAAADWDKYLADLTSARDVIGMTAQQLGEFQARAKGANDEQANLAGIVGSQTEVYKDLEKAIADKDKKGTEGARQRLKELAEEEAKVNELIARTAVLAKTQAMIAQGALMIDVTSEADAAGRAAYQATIDKFNAQIARIESNTVPGSGKRTTGGRSESEAQKFLKQIGERIDALKVEAVTYDAVTESQKQLAAFEQKLLTTKDASLKKQADVIRSRLAEADALERANKAAQMDRDLRKEYLENLDDQVEAAHEQRFALEDQIATYGMTESQVMRLRAAEADEAATKLEAARAAKITAGASAEVIAQYDVEIAKLRDLGNVRRMVAGLHGQVESRELAKEAADDWAQEWEQANEQIGQSLTDALMRGFEDGKGFAENFRDVLKNIFQTMILRPIIEPVVKEAAGTVRGLTGTGPRVGSGGISDAAFLASKAFQPGAGMGTEFLANQVGSAFGREAGMEALIAGNSSNWGVQSNMAGKLSAGLGYASAIYALTEKQYATAIGTAVGTYILPGIGTAIGSMLGGMVDGILGDFSGETRAGAQYGLAIDGQLYNPRRGTAVSATDGVRFLEGPSGGGDSEGVRSAIQATTDGINELFRIVGADVSLAAFWAGFEGSEKGRGGVGAGGSLSTGAAFGESGQGSNYKGTLFDPTRPRTLSAEEAASLLPAQLAQAQLQAWQAAAEQMPEMLAQMLRGVDLAALGDEALIGLRDQFVAVAAQADQLRAALGALPFVPAVAATFDFAAALSQAAGGADNAANLLAGFYQNYYSETERAAHLTDQLTARFAELGYTLPQTREEFRALVQANMALGEGGARTTAELLSMEAALSSLLPAFEAVTETVVDVAAQANAAFEAQLAKVKSLADESHRLLGVRNSAGNLLDQIDRAMGRTGKFGVQREAGLWAVMATASYEQQIDLASELTTITLERYQEEVAAAERLRDLGASLRDYVAGLKLSDVSPLTLGEKLAEAGSQYAEMLARAQAGDTDAMAGLQGMADSYLRLARDYYASSDQYTQIFNSVTGGLDALGIQAQTDAERQLAVGVDSLAQLEQLRGTAQQTYDALDRRYQQAAAGLAQETALLVDLGQDTGRLHDIASLLGSLPAELAARLQPFLDTAARGTVTDWYQEAGRGQGDAAGVDYWQGQLGKQPESQVKDNFLWTAIADWYRADLGRKAADNEIAYWFEYAKKSGTQSAYQAFLAGAQREIDGSHRDGLWSVPYDGYRAELHEEEIVLPVPEARRYRALESVATQGGSHGSAAAEMRELVRNGQAMLEELKLQREENRRNAQAIAETTARSAMENAKQVGASYQESISKQRWEDGVRAKYS